MKTHGQKLLNTLSIIPARAGSKRVPGKNIRSLGGRPLMAWTIAASISSPSISRTVVSTDSEHLASIAKLWGAEVPVLRSPELAEDGVHSYYPIMEMLDYLEVEEKYIPDIVVMLLPTSPFRGSTDIEEALHLYRRDLGQSVISVCDVCPVQRIRRINSKGMLETVVKIPEYNFQAQDVEESYMVNGSIYISSPELLNRYGTFHMAKTVPYIMSKLSSVDIDNEEDFEIAQLLMNSGKR